MIYRRQIKQRGLINFFLVFVVITLALALKLQSVENFLNTDNIFPTHDSFRYIRFAKEIQNHTYTQIDYLVDAPDFRANPKPPFLLSSLAVWLSAILGLKIELIFIFLPPILSVLFIIPLYFWIKTLQLSPIAGEVKTNGERYLFAGGAVLGIFNFIYMIRTSPAYFDTDCLILFFVFSISLFITYAAKEKNNNLKSYGYIMISAFLYKLFMLWYDVYFFGLLFTVSLVFALIIFKQGKSEVLLKSALFILLLDTNSLCKGWEALSSYFKSVFMKESVDLLPVSVFSTIREFDPVTFKQLVEFTTLNYATVILGFIGLTALFYKYFKHMAIISPILAIGLMSFTSGNRYIMYLAPFVGMGLGYTIYLAFEFIKKRFDKHSAVISVIGIALTVFFAFPPKTIHYKPAPFMQKAFYQDLKKLNDLTPQNAFIWTWWDYGFAIEHLAGRATYIDGGNYHPVKMYFIAKSLMTEDEDYSRRLIAFITNNRTKDYLKKDITMPDLLKLAKLSHDKPSNPVYVVIDKSMADYSFIHKLGKDTDGIDKERFPLFSHPYKCNISKDNGDLYDCMSIFGFNKIGGVITKIDAKDDIKRVYREIVYIDKDTQKSKTINYNKNSSSALGLQIIHKNKELYFMTIDLAAKKTVFNRMYVLGDAFKNFERVYDDFPHMVVYRVSG